MFNTVKTQMDSLYITSDPCRGSVEPLGKATLKPGDIFFRGHLIPNRHHVVTQRLNVAR